MILFFFSSRRRHTRLQGDWSSDVCSSDLLESYGLLNGSFRPEARICVLRSYMRQRETLVQDAASQVLHMQKARSEEHTSELQSPCNLVCRLLLEKKKKNKPPPHSSPQQFTMPP